MATISGTDSGAPRANPARTLIGAVVGATVLLLVILCAFALPQVKGGPNGVPLGVAGPQQVVGALQGRLPADAWDVRTYGDARALQNAIKEREVLGGLAVGADGLTVYTATAGGQQAAAAISSLGQAMAAQQQVRVTVEDVVPFPADDPRGVGFTASLFPLIIGGILPAVLLLRLFPGPAALGLRLAGVLLFALVAGFSVVAVLQYGFGSLAGNYWLTSLGLALGMAALSVPLLALGSLLGLPGLGLGAAVMVLLGNPLSGMAGPYWLPSGWAAFGQLLPPGATGSLVRAVAFFDGTGAAAPAVVLGGWVLAGLLLLLAAGRRAARDTQAQAAPAAA